MSTNINDLSNPADQQAFFTASQGPAPATREAEALKHLRQVSSAPPTRNGSSANGDFVPNDGAGVATEAAAQPSAHRSENRRREFRPERGGSSGAASSTASRDRPTKKKRSAPRTAPEADVPPPPPPMEQKAEGHSGSNPPSHAPAAPADVVEQTREKGASTSTRHAKQDGARTEGDSGSVPPTTTAHATANTGDTKEQSDPGRERHRHRKKKDKPATPAASPPGAETAPVPPTKQTSELKLREFDEAEEEARLTALARPPTVPPPAPSQEGTATPPSAEHQSQLSSKKTSTMRGPAAAMDETPLPGPVYTSEAGVRSSGGNRPSTARLSTSDPAPAAEASKTMSSPPPETNAEKELNESTDEMELLAFRPANVRARVTGAPAERETSAPVSSRLSSHPPSQVTPSGVVVEEQQRAAAKAEADRKVEQREQTPPSPTAAPDAAAAAAPADPMTPVEANTPSNVYSRRSAEAEPTPNSPPKHLSHRARSRDPSTSGTTMLTTDGHQKHVPHDYAAPPTESYVQGSALHGFEEGASYHSSDDDDDDDLSDEDGTRMKLPCASCCVDRTDPDSWMNNPPRRHGLQRPLHLLQIIASIVTLLGIGFFWSSVFPGYIMLYSDGHHGCLAELIVFAICVAVGTVCLIVGWSIVTFKQNGDVEGEGEVCSFCRRRTHEDSKHCKACNKCVSGFDHHCKWLNMCVGKKNYKGFMLYVVSAVLTMTMAMISGIVILAKWWHPLGVHNTFFRVGPIILAAVMLIGLPMIVHLLGFHIMLNIKGLSTYEYILEKRDRALHQEPREKTAEKRTRGCFRRSKRAKTNKKKTGGADTNNGNANTVDLDAMHQ